jgi:hypothetical protein
MRDRKITAQRIANRPKTIRIHIGKGSKERDRVLSRLDPLFEVRDYRRIACIDSSGPIKVLDQESREPRASNSARQSSNVAIPGIQSAGAVQREQRGRVGCPWQKGMHTDSLPAALEVEFLFCDRLKLIGHSSTSMAGAALRTYYGFGRRMGLMRRP